MFYSGDIGVLALPGLVLRFMIDILDSFLSFSLFSTIEHMWFRRKKIKRIQNNRRKNRNKI